MRKNLREKTGNYLQIEKSSSPSGENRQSEDVHFDPYTSDELTALKGEIRSRRQRHVYRRSLMEQMKSLIHQSMKNRIVRKASFVLAGIVVFATTYSLILPALTLDYDTLSELPGLHLGQKPVVVEVLNSESSTAQDGRDFLSSGRSTEGSFDGTSGISSVPSTDGAVPDNEERSAVADTEQNTSNVSDTAEIVTDNEASGNRAVKDTDQSTAKKASDNSYEAILWVDKDADQDEIERAAKEMGAVVRDSTKKDKTQEQDKQSVNEKSSNEKTIDEKAAEQKKTEDQTVNDPIADQTRAGDKSQAGKTESETTDVEAKAIVDQNTSVSDQATVDENNGSSFVKEEVATKSLEPTADENAAENISVESDVQDADATVADQTETDNEAAVDEKKINADGQTPEGQTEIIQETAGQEEGFTNTEEEAPAEEQYAPIDLTEGGQGYHIHVTAGPEAKIPANAVLTVSEIPQTSIQYYTLTSIARDRLADDNASIVYNRFFDISFVVDGQTIEPQAAVNVEISFDKAQELQNEQKLSVVHFADNQQAISEVLENAPTITEAGVKSVSFETGSFSIFGVVYTVDFHGEDGYTYSIPGGGYVALSEVVKAVGLVKKDHENSADDEAVAEDDQVAAETEEIADEATPMAAPEQKSHETGTETRETLGDVKEETSPDDEIVPETTEENTDTNPQEQKNTVFFSTEDSTDTEDSTEADVTHAADVAGDVDAAGDVMVLDTADGSALASTQSAIIPLQRNQIWTNQAQKGNVWTTCKNILTNRIRNMFFTPVSASSVEEAPDMNAQESDDTSSSGDPKIREFLANVQNVEFSNPDLVWIGKVDKDTTVGELKTANQLEVQ